MTDTRPNRPRNVGIFIFDNVEVLDFTGPFEVFSIAGLRDNLLPFNVFTIAEKPGPVEARNHLSVNPRHTFENCPLPDIVLIPGGYGTRPLLENRRVLEWVADTSNGAEYVLSVCTGSLILGKAGILDGLTATTHFSAMDALAEAAPGATIDPARRFIDNGRVIVSAGVSAGIDMSLYVVGKILGTELAREAARYMEYDWQPSIA